MQPAISATAPSKPQEGQPGGAQDNKAAAPVSVTEAKPLSEEDMLQKKAFEAKPLENVTKLWFNQVQENEKQFNEAVSNLQSYELSLLRALGDIEKVE